MLNAALTVKKDEPNSHKDIWLPFTSWVINNLWRVKRNLIFVGWGDEAKTLLKYEPSKDPGADGMGTSTKGVNMFFGFVLVDEHPVYASRQNRLWACNHFSKINLIIKGNHLGDPIEW
jgi:uracil DNA glycosylase